MIEQDYNFATHVNLYAMPAAERTFWQRFVDNIHEQQFAEPYAVHDAKLTIGFLIAELQHVS